MLSRRLLVLGTALAATPVAAAPPQLRFADLYVRQGEFPQALQDLAGQTVSMQGFMAPPLKADARFFVLTKLPMATCPFCDSEMDWPDDIVVVKVRGEFVPIDFNLPIGVTGRLELGTEIDRETGFLSRIRIVSAEFARVRR